MTKGVTPDQEFIKIMYDELLAIMGAEQAELVQARGLSRVVKDPLVSAAMWRVRSPSLPQPPNSSLFRRAFRNHHHPHGRPTSPRR